MRRVYQVAALICVLFGAYIVWQSSAMLLYNELGPGPGFFPFWLGIVFAALSVLWLVQVTLQPQPPLAAGFVPSGNGILRLLSIVVAMAAFVALADIIGFQLIMFAFLVFLLTALGRQNPLITIVISVLGSFGIYYVFNTWLEVHLPKASIELLASLGL